MIWRSGDVQQLGGYGDDAAAVVMEDVYGERRGEMEVVAVRGRWC